MIPKGLLLICCMWVTNIYVIREKTNTKMSTRCWDLSTLIGCKILIPAEYWLEIICIP